MNSALGRDRSHPGRRRRSPPLPRLARPSTLLGKPGAILILLWFAPIHAIWSAAGGAEDAPKMEIRFDDSFSGQAGGVDVDPIVPKDLEPELTPGVRGRAFQTRGDKENGYLDYDINALWPGERGTLSFWTKGDNVAVTWESGFEFLTVFGKNGSVMFYKPGRHPWFGNLSRCRMPGANADTDCYLFVPETTAYGSDFNIWRLWAIAWNGKRARLYLDGLLLAETPVFNWPEEPSRLRIGNRYGNAVIRFDELRLYRRPLAGDELRRIWHDTLRPLNTARVAVPLARAPVTLDGQLAPGEWSDASELPAAARGTDGLAVAEPTWFLLKHDFTNLWVAARSPWPAETLKNLAMTAGMTGFVKCKASRRDADLSAEDRFEIHLLPSFPNGPRYRYAINADGVIADSVRAADQEDPSWNPNWTAKTSKDSQGLYLEASIPLRDVGPAGTNTVWGLNFERAWSALKPETNLWVWGAHWVQRPANATAATPQEVFAPAGEMTLGDANVAAVNGIRLDVTSRGQVALSATVTNLAKADAWMYARLGSSSGEVRKDFSSEPDGRLKLIPGGSQRCEHRQDLRNPGTADLFFSASAAANQSNAFYRTEIQFLREQRLEVILWHYPTTNVLRLRLIASRLMGQSLENVAAVFEMFPEGKTAAVESKTLKPLPSAEQEVTLSTKKLAAGRYVVRTRVQEGNQELYRNELPFEKLPLPPWFNTQEGVSDKVPPPFTPLVHQGQTVACWGREYDFQERLLPVQVRTQKMDVLRGPIRLVGSAEGKVLFDTSSLNAKVAWRAKGPGRLEGEVRAKSGSLQIRAQPWIEYDGLLWNTFSFSAPDVTLDRLVLEIPFTRAFSDVINPTDYSLRTTGALPAGGYTSGAHTVWVGNAYGGLQWTFDSRANWSTSKPAEELRVEPSADGATLRITFLDQPVKLDRPVVFAFGLQATPVKPRYPEYRHWLSGDPKIEWGYAWYPGPQVFRPGAEGWFDWKFIQTKPTDYLKNTWWRDTSAKRLCEKLYNGPYVTVDITDASTPDFAQFCDEWANEADKKFVPDPNSKEQACQVGTDVKSYRDYFVWRYARLMDKQPFAALYYDVSGGVGGANPYNDTGVLDREGKRAPTHGMLAVRDLAKRLYTMIKLRYPDGIIKYHNSGVPCLAFMSFAEASVDGENTFVLLSAQKRDYYGTMRPDVWRAEYMGHNLGFVTDFLPQLTRADKWTYAQLATPEGLAVSDHIIGQTILHDSYIWSSYISGDAFNRLQQALRKHKWGNQYRMIPYWEQKVVTLPEKVMATFYVEPEAGSPAPPAIDAEGWYYRSVPGPAKRVIAIVYNDSEWQGPMRLKLDWSQIGIKDSAGYKVENAVHRFTFPIVRPSAAVTGKIVGTGEEQFLTQYTEDPREFAKVENGELVFPMTPWNYRMIVLWKE